MRKSIVYIVLAFFVSINISGCSLFSSGDDEQENATVSEEGAEGAGEAAADGDFGEDDFGGDEFGGDDFASDGFESGDGGDFDAVAAAKDDVGGEIDALAGQDVEVEDAFGDPYADDDFGTPAAAAGDVAAADDFSEDYIDDNSFSTEDDESSDYLSMDEGGGLPADTMSSNQEGDLFAQDMAPVVDTPASDYDSSYDSGYSDSGFGGGYTDPEPKGYVSVKKMKPAAYKRAGGNVNRLYVVRPGDNMDSIAEKLYGDAGKSEDLYGYNSHFRGKTLSVGDKIYYESPNSPNDQSMMTYYEDNNIAPQYYTSQEGDNIRKVAKQLLGHDRSWMEVYATNESVETKSGLPSGLQLRYWPEGSSGAAPVIAMNDPIEEPDPMPEPVAPIPDPEPIEEPDMAGLDEPDMGDLDEPTEVADLDDPKPMGDPMDDGMSAPPPPPPAAGTTAPPPPKPVAPPPPPAPTSKFNKPTPPRIGGGAPNMADDPMAAIGNDSTIMAALGGLLILAFIIMLIFIRRSRAKRVNFSQTQV